MKKITKIKWKDWVFAWSVYLLPAISFIIFWLLINIHSIVLAFQNYNFDTGNLYFVGLDNFIGIIKEMTQEGDILRISLRNSLINYLVGLLGFAISLLFSFYIYKKFFAHQFIRIAAMLPKVISSFILCLVVKKMLEDGFPMLAAMMGNPRFPKLLTDDKYAYMTTLIYSIWLSFTGYCIIIPNAMNAIDPEIIESAQIDGASLYHEYFHFVLPLIYPTISTYLILGLSSLLVGQGPLVEFYMFGAPPSTYNMGYYLYAKTMNATGITQQQLIYPKIAALSLMITIVTAPVVFLVRKWLNKYDYTEAK